MSDDFKLFTINTMKEWMDGCEDGSNLEALDGGIVLLKEPSHIFYDKIIQSEKWTEITDIAVDNCGVIYILDSGKQIITDDTLNNQIEVLKLPRKFKGAQGIALSSDTLYVVDAGGKRILAFSKINWQIRWIVELEDLEHRISKDHAGKFIPTKIAADDSGNIYVLDEAHHRIIEFDEGGNFKGIHIHQKLEKPVDIWISKQDNHNFLYVLDEKKDNLDEKKNKVLKFKTGEKYRLVKPEFILGNDIESPSGVAVDSKGNVYLGDRSQLKKDEYGFIYKFSPSGDEIGPFAGYQGPCYGMLIDENDNLYVTTGEKKEEIVFLKFVEERYTNHGTFVKFLDSKKKGCKWHKIVLQAEIPDKTQINVLYHTSDQVEVEGDVMDWQNISFLSSSANLCDALILEGSGRYLWLKLELITTDEYKTPKVKGIKIFYPHDSYLRYLPAIYQEDELSKDFLDRFLSLFETFMWDVDDEIKNIAGYFDVETTPSEFLSWIATWIAAIFDESWSDWKKRKFLQEAVDIYKKRGTREGLEEILKIYTGINPIIVENWQLYESDGEGGFNLRCGDDQDLKNLFENLFGKPTPYRFSVILKPVDMDKDQGTVDWTIEEDKLENQMKKVKRLLEIEKPAHTVFGIIILRPWFYLDMHTYLGVNTYLSKPSMVLGKNSVVGRDTVLSDAEEAGQLERRARIGIDTNLS